MGWIAGYHDHFELRRYERHDTWKAARAAIVDELDQRIMALQAEPETRDADELSELEAALTYFASEVRTDEEAASDAAWLTFVLVPETAAALVTQTDAFVVEVIR